MAVVRKATAADFDKVHILLASMEGPRLAKEKWRGLFIDHWNSEEGYFGYVLVDGDEVVGFMSMLFTQRKFSSHTLKVCNLNSWVVKEKYRAEGLKMVMPLSRMKEYLLTTLTANKNVSYIFSKLGFKTLDSCWIIIPPIPTAFSLVSAFKYRFIFELSQIPCFLAGDDLKIFEDHKHF